MSVTQPVRCLLARSATRPPCWRRAFHSSRSLCTRRKPAFPSIKASKLGLVPQLTANHFPPYSAAEKAALTKKYTPAQIAAIEAGEAAVDPNDLAIQGTIREDPMALEYLDDLSEIHPVVDKPVRAPESNYDPNLRLKDEDELADDVVKWVMNLPQGPKRSESDRLEWMKFSDNLRLTVGKEEAERNPRSSLAPELPKIDGLKPRSAEKDGNEDIDAGTRRLMLQTGYSAKSIRRFRIKQLVVRRVNNQTRLGRVQSTYFLMVAGNGRGLLGIGEGKSTEPDEGKKQASLAAIRNLRPIPRYEERTIYGDVKGKVGGTELTLMTRPPGFGIRCQSLIYEICKCAGISDLAARVGRSRNPMNTVKATMQALLRQQFPEDIARARGKKLVDVRKVYYNGNL